MSQTKEDKSDSENESSSDSKSGSSSDSESESGSGSSNSSSSDNEGQHDRSRSTSNRASGTTNNTSTTSSDIRDGAIENGLTEHRALSSNNHSTAQEDNEKGGDEEEEDEEDDESDDNNVSASNEHGSVANHVQATRAVGSTERSRSSNFGSDSDESDPTGGRSAKQHHSDSDASKPSNTSRQSGDDDEGEDDEEEHDENSAGNETASQQRSANNVAMSESPEDYEDDDEDHHSSKSSYDDEDYAANQLRRKSARKKAVAAARKRPAAQPASKAKKKKSTSSRWKSDTSDESEASDSDASDRFRRKSGAAAAKKRAAAVAASKAKAKKKKRTGGSGTGAYSTDEASSEEDRKRPSASRRTTAVSYKEASGDEATDSDDLLEVDQEAEEAAAAAAAEEEKAETIERIIGRRQGRKGATGALTTVYAIEEHGDPNLAAEGGDHRSEEQYLIKWSGWSYLHSTWESEETLKEQKVKGMKKLENYLKREEALQHWRQYQAGPEDIDYYECQQELQQDLLKSHYNVERIIAQADKAEGGEGTDYLCKWESLPYSDSTWEDASLLRKKWQRKVVEFHEREESRRTPSKHCKAIRYRPNFRHLKTQPEYLGEDRGLKLRDYQMDGLNWLILTWCKENSVILADEMGLGKTIQTICFLYYLFKSQQLYGPFLCVVPLSTMPAWQREFAIWAPEMNFVTYLGDVQSREMIRQYEWCFDSTKKLKFNAILTTYEILLKDKTFLGSISWASLLVDEAHRLKNDDSLLYKALEEFDTNHRLLITGTPLQNSLKELWALLHFIMPQHFASWDDFERNYGSTNDKSYTKLHKELEPYILRRVKKDVEKSLPAKVEQILRVEMTSIQRQFYRWILTKNFNELRKGLKGSASTFLNIVIELKKCCNHASLTRPMEFGAQVNQDTVLQQLLKGSGKLVLLDKLLCRLKETGHRVLIFSQMVRMLDILAEYLQKRHFSFQRLDGSIKGELRKQALDHFNAEGSTDFCFLLSTRAGGLGINLATADTVIIFDSDWNPQNDLQAQARAHRIGQKNQVNIYRLVTARSVEEDIVERAKQKMVLDHLVIQRMDTTGRTVLDGGDKNSGNSWNSKVGAGNSNSNPFKKDELSAILKFGAEELFNEKEDGDEELVCDIDEILRRAETRDEAPGMPGDELLSAFNVTTFDFDEDTVGGKPITAKDPEPAEAEGTKQFWDDVIPQSYRVLVEAEERDREIKDLYLPPRRLAMKQNETGGKGGKKAKKGAHQEESDEDSEASVGGGRGGVDEDGKGKRARGRPSNKEKIAGFTDAELRQLIKSYKKFPAPLKRLEAIACDAELQEKPLSDLRRVSQLLHDRCVQTMKEIAREAENEKHTGVSAGDAAKRKCARAAYSNKIGGASFNVKTMMQCVEELQPLDEVIPADPVERSRWQLNFKTRPPNFDVEWSGEDDSRLLRGIYQYGIGSWDAMKMDPSLGLSDKILANDANRKPQGKHLQSRAEYLLKVLRKTLELKRGPSKPRKPRKPKEPKAAGGGAVPNLMLHPAASAGSPLTSGTDSIGCSISATIAAVAAGEDVSLSVGGPGMPSGGLVGPAGGSAIAGSGLLGAAGLTEEKKTGSKSKKLSESENHHHHHNYHHHHHDEHSNGSRADEHHHYGGKDQATAAGGKEKKKSKKDRQKDSKKKKDKNTGPMHFTANNEPCALNILGDLDPTVFNECKEKMRPVKKALKTLDNPDETLPQDEQLRQTRDCLLSIGNQINLCLGEYRDPEKAKEWRSNLWYFVSKFTEYDARKLFRLYKHALKRSEGTAADRSGGDTSTDGGGGVKKSSGEHSSGTAPSLQLGRSPMKDAKDAAKHHQHHYHLHPNHPAAAAAAGVGIGQSTSSALNSLGKIKKISNSKQQDNGHSSSYDRPLTSPLKAQSMLIDGGTGGGGMDDEKARSRRERKDKKRHHLLGGTVSGPIVSDSALQQRERYMAATAAAAGGAIDHGSDSGGGKEEGSSMHSKRRLEEGEYDENSKEYKRLHGDSRNHRGDRDKKWDEYGDRDRMRNIGSRGAASNTPQSGRGFPDSRDDRGSYVGVDASVDRWRDRYGGGEHKRDRYEGYGSRHMAPSGYHRDRDRDREREWDRDRGERERDRERDRDRDRGERFKDKRRHMPPGTGSYPSNHYGMPPAGYYSPADGTSYRSYPVVFPPRQPPGGGVLPVVVPGSVGSSGGSAVGSAAGESASGAGLQPDYLESRRN